MDISSVSLSQSLYTQIASPDSGVNQQIAIQQLKQQMNTQADLVSKIIDSGMTYTRDGRMQSASTIDIRM